MFPSGSSGGNGVVAGAPSAPRTTLACLPSLPTSRREVGLTRTPAERGFPMQKRAVFEQGFGNHEFARRRTVVRRTAKLVD